MVVTAPLVTAALVTAALVTGFVTQDTTTEFQRVVDAAYAKLAPEERVRICAEMFESARALVEASLPDGLDPDERRFRLCERFYGDLATRALRGRASQ